jgi:methionine-rich copper-binding protein CopC
MRPPAVVGRLVVLALLAAGVLLGAAGPGAAHSALVSSSPGAGDAVTDSPRAITLTFNEPVSLPDRPLLVRDADGTTVDLRVTPPRTRSASSTPRAARYTQGVSWADL